MAKASITKKMALNGHGILEINDDGIFYRKGCWKGP